MFLLDFFFFFFLFLQDGLEIKLRKSLDVLYNTFFFHPPTQIIKKHTELTSHSLKQHSVLVF